MATTTRKPKIDVDPRTGEARCAHHDCWGNVCDACFDATPNLVVSAGMTYRLPAFQIAEEKDSKWIEKISPLTVLPVEVKTTEVREGDKIDMGRRTPITVARILCAGDYTLTFEDDKGKAYRIQEATVPVLR